MTKKIIIWLMLIFAGLLLVAVGVSFACGQDTKVSSFGTLYQGNLAATGAVTGWVPMDAGSSTDIVGTSTISGGTFVVSTVIDFQPSWDSSCGAVSSFMHYDRDHSACEFTVTFSDKQTSSCERDQKDTNTWHCYVFIVDPTPTEIKAFISKARVSNFLP